MLIVCRTKAPRRGLTVTGSQHHRTRRVAMHEQTGHRRRPMPLWLAMADMHSAVETESEVKKCSLTAIGKVSTPASRIQVEIEHVLKKHESLINELTDDQYKVINEAVSSALYTINQEKLSYLVQVVNNAAQEGSYCQGASDHLSRVIRDISADEILFLLRSVQYEGVAVTDSDVKNDTLLKIPPGSHDELLMTGLLHLGLVFAKDSTWSFQVYKWSPIVRNLIALLESNNQ